MECLQDKHPCTGVEQFTSHVSNRTPRLFAHSRLTDRRKQSPASLLLYLPRRLWTRARAKGAYHIRVGRLTAAILERYGNAGGRLLADTAKVRHSLNRLRYPAVHLFQALTARGIDTVGRVSNSPAARPSEREISEVMRLARTHPIQTAAEVKQQ